MNLADLAKKGTQIAIIAIDETKFWKDAIVAKAKRIDAVYMVNLTMDTNLCSINVDYPVIALRNVLQDVEHFDEDKLTELENVEGIDGEVRYFNEYFNNFKLVKEYSNNETEEEVEEYERCNPTFF